MQDLDYINFKIFDILVECLHQDKTCIEIKNFNNTYRYDSKLDTVFSDPKKRWKEYIPLKTVSRIPHDLTFKQVFFELNYNRQITLTNHSFEPILYEIDHKFWNILKNYIEKFLDIPNDYFKNDYIILHSEISSEVSALNEYNCIPVHFFGNGVLAAEHWYRNYTGIKLYEDYKAIEHKFICANRLIDEKRKYRIKFLNLIDVNAGLYSLLERDPYTGVSLNEILPANRIKPNSFDNHNNSSSEIVVSAWNEEKEIYNFTPWATSFLHIVSETMIDRVHLTEKVFKPVVLKQPFVLLCGAGALNYLKGYGFKTFDGFWSEEYDQIQDEDKRLQAVADIVNRIGKMTLAECEQMREQMKPILEHNYNWFYNGFADQCWQELRDNLVSL